MKQSKLPTGWDEPRVKRVLAHYEQQTEEEAIAEDEAAARTFMQVPRKLVPAVASSSPRQAEQSVLPDAERRRAGKRGR